MSALHRHRACLHPGAAAAAHRAPRRRVARRARADGRHHQPGLPPALPRVRHGRSRGGWRVRGDEPVRVRDGDHPGTRGAHPGDDAAHLARPRRAPALGAALLRRPGHGRVGGPHPRRRGPRRPHRPQLRLPGAQGHPQGRRRRAAVEDRPVPRHRRGGGARGRAVRRAGHREDAGRHRRRPRDLPGCRADRRGRGRRGGRAARAHRGAGVLGPGRLVGDRPAQGGRHDHPGARQRRHLVGRGRPGDGARDRLRRGRRGAWLPRAALAVHGPGGGVRRVRRRGCSRGCAR